MRIQHNIAALNSHRNLGINNSFTNKNLEKLSSGFRINRAGDDAAGLAISEKMRGQIRGLAMAEQNTQNGISLIQTAEGGLNETHAILQRMRELAVQSSNGTYDEEVDRANLDLEFQAVKDEIDRIASSTHYNGIKLLDGSLGGKGGAGNGSEYADVVVRNATGVANAAGDYTKTAATADKVTGAGTAAGLEVGDSIYIDYVVNGETQRFEHTLTADDLDDVTYGKDLREAIESAFDISEYDIDLDKMFTNNGTGIFGVVADGATAVTVNFENLTIATREKGQDVFAIEELGSIDALTGANTIASNGDDLTIDATGTDAKVTIALNKLNRTIEIDGQKFQFVNNENDILEDGAIAIYVAADDAVAAADLTSVIAQMREHGVDVRAEGGALAIYANGKKGGGNGEGLVFQIGANGGADQRVTLNVDAMDSRSIGSAGKSLRATDISTRENANAAIDVITDATNMVSAQRAGLGALQNRLEHTLNNLGTTKENLTSAESVIRDVDMAKEMMEFTKNQILVQSSQAMLAQANQLPQGVLSLLR